MKPSQTANVIRLARRTFVVAALAQLTVLVGCNTSTTSTAARDTMTQHVGQYAPPPPGIQRARVGVPPFKVSGQSASAKMNTIAADQATTLAFRTQRFSVIERAQLEQLLKEQGLEGIVKPGELAKPGQVRGVDYLLIGKISNFRVAQSKSKAGFGLGDVRLPFGARAGGLDVKSDKTEIVVECGVDLRLVDPTSGEVAAAHFGEYTRTDAANAWGVKILGTNAQAGADLKISDSDRGKILRLALDEAIRKMLPDVDQALVTKAAKNAANVPAPTPSTGGGNDTAAKFCPHCGKKNAGAAKFCAHCGKAQP